MKIISVFMFLSILLFAKSSISIPEILKSNFSQDINVEKKRLILSKKEAQNIQKAAKARLNSRAVVLYKVKKGDKTIGHGVLLRQRIRSKNANVLYMIDSKRMIKAIEIVSFKEPIEYKPNKKWQNEFKGKNDKDDLKIGQDISLISGSTMSVKSITNSARIALAILNIIYKPRKIR